MEMEKLGESQEFIIQLSTTTLWKNEITVIIRNVKIALICYS